MKVKVFTPLWGYEARDFGLFCRQVTDAGFDGVELNLAAERADAEAQLGILQRNGLEYIAQHSGSLSPVFKEHRDHYRRSLVRIAGFNPQRINSHTGRDFFSFEQNLELIDAAAEISKSTGVPIVHETHRGRFPYHALLTSRYLNARPDLRLTADFSHWCCVSESMLEGQEELLAFAIERADHIHARVGHAQGPQVNDPRAPEWESVVARFLGWWDRIVEIHRTKGASHLTVTAEFGPEPYTPVLPFTQQSVASQWELNLHMMDVLRTRYR